MRVLLIEDDLQLGRAMNASLIDVGHEVVWVRMAEAGRAHIRDEELDVVLLDLGLPDGEGLSVLREARRLGNTVPVLIVTAEHELSRRLEGLDAGADDYIVKPFDPAELVARIRAVMRRGGNWSSEPTTLSAGKITLDEQAMVVKKDEQRVALSPTEYALLLELMRNHNRVRTRRQLESAALPESEGQSLDVHMSNLRRKVGNDIIRTVRGVGYVIEGN